MPQSPGERLLLFRNQLQLKQKEFAKELGVAAGGIGFVERDERLPSRELLGKLTERYNLSADWLLHGRGDMLMKKPSFDVPRKTFNPMRSEDQLREAGQNRRGDQLSNDVGAFSFIGTFDITNAPFPGTVVMNHDLEAYMAFSMTYLDSHNVDPDRAGLVRATNDNMEPFAPNGSRALVDFTARDKFSEGLHIFRFKGSVQVRQLLPIGGGDEGLRQVVAFSINPTTTTLIEGSDLKDFEIIGRVVTIISDT